jgi:hypothetical protein
MVPGAQAQYNIFHDEYFCMYAIEPIKQYQMALNGSNELDSHHSQSHCSTNTLLLKVQNLFYHRQQRQPGRKQTKLTSLAQLNLRLSLRPGFSTSHRYLVCLTSDTALEISCSGWPEFCQYGYVEVMVALNTSGVNPLAGIPGTARVSPCRPLHHVNRYQCEPCTISIAQFVPRRSFGRTSGGLR